MNKKVIIIFKFLLVIVWLAVIFYLSSMDNNESNYKSKKTINTVVTAASHEIEKSEEHIVTSNEKKENFKFNIDNFVDKINPYIRKCAHAFVYMVLAILLLNAFNSFDISKKRLLLMVVLFCMLYAITDEYHQTFVAGRSGRVFDICVDTVGSIIGCGIYFTILKCVNMIKKIFAKNL